MPPVKLDFFVVGLESMDLLSKVKEPSLVMNCGDLGTGLAPGDLGVYSSMKEVLCSQ
jgi:hypothetical protein